MINNDAVVEWRKICSHCQSEFVDKMFRPFHMRVRDFKEAPGTCKQCYKKRSEELKKLRDAAGLYWTFDSVKEYFEDNPPYEGQELLIFDTSWNTNTYAIVTVKVASSGRQKRIIVESYSNGYSGQSFYRSGKNCWAPTGQVKLLPYNEIIGALAKKAPMGELRLRSEEVFELIGEK
ncbi:hypothetical protein [Aeromonas dhakensis]|uniref:hypothetical protein n=1 Tax=Aeromonas dhakensis TaxID=196024 RepID=UPI001BFC4B9A|nr:hypothetical protein [Aeromonas dhakensis]HDT5890042.1 hypothetical protein [Aeromonas dhakensis]HEB4977476.1 hypothetical protein [Aeromonas dhakensis]